MKERKKPAPAPTGVRARAEQRMRERRVDTPPPPSEHEALRLVHELQVHQVELEMQNEELQRAHAEMDAVRARYFDLYDRAPVGYMTLGDKGRILEANLTAAKLFGVSRSKLVKQPIERWFLPEDHEVWRRGLRQLTETGAPVECDVRMCDAQGPRRWMHLNASMDQNAGGEPECRVTVTDISDQKRSREAIESLARFPSENPGAVLRIMGDGTLTYANPASRAMLRQLGGSEGDQAPDLLRQPALAALASGAARDAEFTCGDRIFGVTCAPVASGGYVNIYGRDITARRAAERAEQLSRAREREAMALATAARTATDVLDAMGEGVLLCQLDGCIRSANPALERLSGCRTDELVGQPVDRFLSSRVAEEDRDAALSTLRDALRGETRGVTVFKLLVGGRRVPVICGISYIRGSDGKPTAVIASLRDISELRRVQRTLHESEEKYRELVENANSIIMRTTPDHEITFFNEYAQTFFGYTSAEVVGRNALGTIVPEVDSEGRDLREMVRAITANPELHASNENENVCKDGRRVWVHWANRPIRDKRGKLIELLCVGTDITRRREMEADAQRYQQRLRELAERLAGADEENRWRISRYIHDSIVQNLSLSCIRLGTMAGPLAVAELRQEAATVGQIQALLDRAIDECRRVMSDLTPPLLYELGLIPALRELAQRLARDHDARVVIEGAREEPMPRPLLGFLFESVRELVMNALKHAGPCEVRVTVACGKGHVTARVEDNGAGFDAERAARPPDHRGGFGLFSVRQRLEGLGGCLELESAPGKGTTATLRVPIAAASPERGEG